MIAGRRDVPTTRISNASDREQKMTTIILVAIGVLIAAVAAIMMIFYGGDAFSDSKQRADAARLVQESAQVEYAFDLYTRQEGQMPGLDTAGNPVSGLQAINDLKAKKYLSYAPLGMQDAISNGTFDGNWAIDYNLGVIRSSLGPATINGEPNEDALGICREARKQLYLPEPEKVYKCDGSDVVGGGGLSSREPCCITVP